MLSDPGYNWGVHTTVHMGFYNNKPSSAHIFLTDCIHWQDCAGRNGELDLKPLDLVNPRKEMGLAITEKWKGFMPKAFFSKSPCFLAVS